MKKAQQTSTPQVNQVQGLVTEGKLVVSEDGRYVTVYFADGSRLREHRNRFLAVLGEPFTAEPKKDRGENTSTMATGYFARTRMFLSKDGNYLAIYFPGGRFWRHVNYIRAALGLSYQPVAKAQA